MTTRKVFLAQLAGGGIGLLLAACGGGGSDDDTDSTPRACRTSFTIGGHEGHVLSIPGDDLNSTVAKTYGIQGSAPHDHQVTITPAQFADLKAGRNIELISTETLGLLGLHTHTLVGACATT